MLTDLDHLPQEIRPDLQLVREVLFSELSNTLVLSTQEWNRQERILKVILFEHMRAVLEHGSYRAGVGQSTPSLWWLTMTGLCKNPNFVACRRSAHA